MDYDVSAVALSSPPVEAPLTTYTPAVSVRNNGLYAAIATGYVQAYKAGVQVYYSTLQSEPIGPGEIGLAIAADDWTPDDQADYIFFGYVTQVQDQVERNNNLPPITVHVGPPPPPPEPATLDDVVEKLDTLSTEETLGQVKDKLPTAPSTEPTLEEVRDKLPTGPATEATLALIESKIPSAIATEATLGLIHDQLPDELSESGALKVDVTSSIIPAPLAIPDDYEFRGKTEVGTTASVLLFAGHTRAILIQADPNNTGNVYIGSAFLDTLGNHALCCLQPGDSIALDYDDDKVSLYVCATVAAQNIIYGATLQP